MHNPVPVQENDSHKLLWDFNIQTDQLIPARRPNLILIIKKEKKENLQNCRFVIGAFGILTKGLLMGLEDLEVGGRV